jgi:ribose 5-phosphate isomerase RpiB
MGQKCSHGGLKGKRMRHTAINGHYHFELANGTNINESDLSTAIQKVQKLVAKKKTEVVDAGFICTYGCGMIHALNDNEINTIADELDFKDKKMKKDRNS